MDFYTEDARMMRHTFRPLKDTDRCHSSIYKQSVAEKVAEDAAKFKAITQAQLRDLFERI